MDRIFGQEDLRRFHKDCHENRLYNIVRFVDQGYPVNSHADSSFGEQLAGYTPLHFAVKHKNRDALIYLLKKGANITKRSANSWTPVHLAYYTLDNDSVFTIFEHSIVNKYVHAVDGTGLSHFHICCALNVPVIETFIKNRAKVNGSVSLAANKNGGFTPLHFAVQSGHSSAASLLIARGANIRMKCGRGFTPLHVACERSDSSMVELLLTNDDNQETLTTKDNEGLIPLHVACKKSDPSVVELLLTFDADLNTLKTKDNRGLTARHYAAEQGSATIVELLMENGASMHAPNSKENETPFDLAVKRRRYDVFDVISSRWNSANEASSIITFSATFGLDDFHHACSQENLEVVKRYLNHGFSVNGRAASNVENKFSGYTPLHFAVENDREDIAIHLLQNGADITIKDDYGRTPVHLAYRTKLSLSIANLFVHSKINTFVNVANESDLTHFHICCTLNSSDMAENFLLNGADVKSSTSLLSFVDAGFTPLHFAAQKGGSPIVKLLLENGGDLFSTCKRGSTPLHLACDSDNVDSARTLLEFGADYMAKDGMSRLPLHCAFYKWPGGPIAKLLLEKLPTHQNHTDSQRLSLLHMACFYGRSDIVQKFLDQGCCPNSRVMLVNEEMSDTTSGITPFHKALHATDEEITRQLILAGADINAQDESRKACRVRRVLFMLLMNEKMSDAMFANGRLSSGITPLHIALYVRNLEIAKQLILAGADVNAEDEKGNSTISYSNASPGKEKNTDIEFLNSDIYLLIVQHITKLETAGLYVSEKVKKINSDFAGSLFFKAGLRRELDRMQGTRITERVADLNLRSILGKSETEMCRLVKNEDVKTRLNPAYLDQLVEEFPLYGFMIKYQVSRGLRKVAMTQNAKDSLNCLTGFNWPDLCSEQIFKHLRTEHLESLIDANVHPK